MNTGGIGLGLDFETTGLDTSTCRILEIGVVQFKFGYILNSSSWLVSQPEAILYDEELRKISKLNLDIHAEMVGFDEVKSILRLNTLMKACDYVMAYNGRDYDQKVYENTCKRLGIEVIERLWVDPMHDIEYPEEIASRKLVYLAAEHGLLNPFPHRALFDVLSMLNIAFRYDEDRMLRMAEAPSVRVQALVSYNDRDLAKAMGFSWDGDKKEWYKEVKDIDDNLDRLKTAAAEKKIKLYIKG